MFSHCLMGCNKMLNHVVDVVVNGRMFPLQWETTPVEMVVSNENSIDVFGGNSDEDWERLVPSNGGFVFLGDDLRRYGMSMCAFLSFFIQSAH